MSGRATSSGASGAIGFWSTTALVVGHTIGVGVFLTPATLIGAIASPGLTLGVWLACAAMVFAGALAFGELAARFPRAGGAYVYLREAWGEQAAFLYGWQCLLVMDPGVTAALAAGVADYAEAAWPSLGNGRWLAVAAIWALAMLHTRGVRLSAGVQSTLTAIKVVALLVVVALAFGAGSGSWSHFTPFMTRVSPSAGIGEAVALGFVGAFFSFGGFWEASRVAGEIRDPRRTLARALGAGVLGVTAIYLATTLAFVYLVPRGTVTEPAAFTRAAGLAMLGEPGPQVLSFVVLVSVVASMAALLMMAPRLYVAMSRDGALPRWLAPRDAGRDTSSPATLLLAGLASLYTLVGTFQQIVAFFFCTTLAFVGLAVAGLFILRRRSGLPSGAFRCPGYPVVPTIFVALVAAIATTVLVARPVQALSGIAIVLLGLPAYRVLRSRGALARSVSRGVES